MEKIRNKARGPGRSRLSIRSGTPEESGTPTAGTISRRSFLHTGLTAGAGTVAAGLLPSRAEGRRGGLTRGDEAILRFLSAAEILETDAWQQYNELCGVQDSEVPGGTGNILFTAALAVLDEDMDQYVHDNTEDEFTHFSFINAYLVAHGGKR
jgi:hypothetical protein